MPPAALFKSFALIGDIVTHLHYTSERGGGYGLSRRCTKENGKDFGNSPCPAPSRSLIYCHFVLSPPHYSPRPRRGTPAHCAEHGRFSTANERFRLAWAGAAQTAGELVLSSLASPRPRHPSSGLSLCDRSRRRRFRRKTPFPPSLFSNQSLFNRRYLVNTRPRGGERETPR